LSFCEVQRDEAASERSCLLVIGTGTFASRVAESCERRFDCITAPSLAVAHVELSRRLIQRAGMQRPWAAILAFDPAGSAPDLGPELRAHWDALCACCEVALPILALSCDRLFNGWRAQPYLESDPPDARDAAGSSWRAFESAVSSLCSQALIVRAGYVMDARDPADPLALALESLRMELTPGLAESELISPTYLPDLTDAALDLLVDGERAIWHLTSGTACSPFELVRRCAEQLGLMFQAKPAASSRRCARGPMRALESTRGWPLPDLSAALSAYTQVFERRWRAAEPVSARTGVR
jgi:dTDP-4-dehydrorhamnose reductase